jgi:hypothetical protein
MSKSRKLILFVLLAAVIAGTCSFAGYALVLGFTEDLYFKRWSVAHLLFTPSFIEHLPKPNIMGEVVYYHSCGDGPKPPAEGLSFETIASKDQILTEFERYLVQNGYSQDTGPADFLDYQYSKGKTKFNFSVQPRASGKNLVVAQESYFQP